MGLGQTGAVSPLLVSLQKRELQLSQVMGPINQLYPPSPVPRETRNCMLSSKMVGPTTRLGATHCLYPQRKLGERTRHAEFDNFGTQIEGWSPG
ncbi:hypothetical protein AVEN_27913-1 [Araneus ventricosus]|uniref:Uncharacterized protein n=1 Tax=Araneus ventricosus TaxID=182803 RepID=A0A4Y2HLW9_ARAVE|nr:hypothetical protein AVEN_27913-1 [Araneus ventricosus]